MRLGIIGPSLIWEKKHRPALEQLREKFEITAFCASSERRKAEVLAGYPNAAFVTDYEAFVRRDDIDGVAVLTPIALNAPVSLAALRAGKDVFLEKPMSHDLALGRSLVKEAAAAGRRLWVVEQVAYDPQWRQLQALVASGRIGEPIYFDYTIHWPMDQVEEPRGGYGNTAWRVNTEFPLGPLFDGGHHQMAILSILFGHPEWVFASGVKLRPDFGDYDHIVMQFGHSGHLRGTMSHSAALGDQRNNFWIHGTRGTIAVEAGQWIIEDRAGNTDSVPIAPVDTHVAMWSHFADCIAAGRDAAYPAAHALGDLTTLFAVEQSIKSRQRVDVAGM